jgi:hypothetical protein
LVLGRGESMTNHKKGKPYIPDLKCRGFTAQFGKAFLGARPIIVVAGQPTTQPTKCDVLCGFRVFWQSARSCNL